jgi:Kef-type K+ transport system membrane component KefB
VQSPETMSLTNIELAHFFLVIVVLLASAHFFGYVFEKCRFSKVMGEICGGIVLGPSLVGYFFPAMYQWLFNAFPSEGKLLSMMYWLGLVFLMFISGFELKKSFDRHDVKIICAIFLGSTSIPFLAGWCAPLVVDFSPFMGRAQNALALQIVTAIAVSITAIPVIAKMFIDLHISETRFARVVITTATLHDIVLWVALAVATSLVSGEVFSFSAMHITIIFMVIFFFLALFIIPTVMSFINKSRYNVLIKSSSAGYVLIVCFFFAALASILHVHILFGGFLAGVIIGAMPDNRFHKEKVHIKEIALSFFIPLSFALVGLKLDFIHHGNLVLFLYFLLFAVSASFAGTIIAAKLCGKDWLSSFNLGVAMNVRGALGIVLASVAFDVGIINETFFLTLVLVAMVTSIAAGYWFTLVAYKKWELLT